MCEVRFREKIAKNKPPKENYSGQQEKKRIVMNPI
jgi:hypothetical protein